MSNFIDSLKGYLHQNMISKAAELLDENDTNISKTAEAIFASLMGVFVRDNDIPHEKNILDEAANLDISAHAKNIFSDNPSQNQQNIGDDFLQHLLGDRAAAFSDTIANKVGVSKVVVNRMVSMLAPIFAGFMGRKLKNDYNGNVNSLKTEIKRQKDSFMQYIPSTLFNSFGLSYAFGNSESQPVVQKKKKNNWLIWVIVGVIIILLLLWWKSCRNESTHTRQEVITTIDEKITQQKNNNSSSGAASATRSMREITLPNGIKINVPTGGMEDKMVAFLNSGEYKNATDKDLQNKWFVFEDIHFAYNSSTELTDESQLHINNIVEILKSYKNAKIKVAAFTDKRGTEAVNLEISKKRAKTIESIFANKGIGSQVLTAEGYGEEFAKYSADAPNDERAKDRDIALRFTK